MYVDDANDITHLLNAMRSGDEEAANRLMEHVYRELHALAIGYMRRERDEHTLQPTALVHEAFLRMASYEAPWESRAHFYGVAAQAMRRILVDHARRKAASKREAGQEITLDDSVAESPGESVDLVALDIALDRLAALAPRQAKVVELRYFAGMELTHVAEALGTSLATVKRDWLFAKAFLHREMSEAAS